MDTNLGSINLTKKQLTQLDTLKDDVFKGFSFWDEAKEVVAVSTRELTPQEIIDISNSISSLPDEYSQDYLRSVFDLVLFQTDLADLLPSLSDPNLRWEFAALNTYATNKDFEGMAGYMDMLVSVGAAQQSDDDAVIALLTKQGIEV